MDFDHSYSFVYSKRPGTPAADLPDNVDLATKKERLATFQQVIMDSTIAKTKAMVGQTVTVLVEELSDRMAGHLHASAENTRSVVFKGDKDLLGKLVDVHITDYKGPHMVAGELVAVVG